MKSKWNQQSRYLTLKLLFTALCCRQIVYCLLFDDIQVWENVTHPDGVLLIFVGRERQLNHALNVIYADGSNLDCNRLTWDKGMSVACFLFSLLSAVLLSPSL